MENIKAINVIVESRDTHEPTEPVGANPYIASVATAMRIIGVILIISASVMFMGDKWSYWSHLTRYGTFLSFTLLVGGCGLLCGLRLHDPKGARTLLALSTALLPVLLAQLGALLFSCFPEAQTHDYSELYRWVAPGLNQTIGMAILSLVLLIPLTALSFSTLVKNAKTETTILYSALSLALLIPLRNDSFVLITTLCAMVAYAWYERYIVSKETTFKTFEGTIIRLILWWPLFIFAGRNIMLYRIAADSLIPSLNFACIGLAMLTLGLRLELARWVHLIIDFSGCALCWVAVARFLDLPFVPTQTLFGQESHAPVGIGILVVTYYLNPLFRSGKNELQALSSVVASLLCILALDTVVADLTCVLVGLWIARKPSPYTRLHWGIGWGMTLAGSLKLSSNLIVLLHLGEWPIYAFVGLGTIIASSFLERANRARIVQVDATGQLEVP